MFKIFATRQLDIAEKIVASVMQRSRRASVFDYERKSRVVNTINKELYKITKGFFKDEYWEPVQKIWDYFKTMDTRCELDNAEYGHDSNGRPSHKIWKFKVYFINEKGKEIVLYGSVTASGAGTVEDPLSIYDVTAYVS